MTVKTLNMKLATLKFVILAWVTLSIWIMSPALTMFLPFFLVTSDAIDVTKRKNDRHPITIGNQFIHLNFVQALDTTAYGSLTTVAVVASGSESLTGQNVDGIIRNGCSLVYNLRNSLRDGNITALDNGTVNATWELFYDQWRLAYLNGVSALADSALDWETTTGTPQSEDQIKLLGFLFGLKARGEFFVKKPDKAGQGTFSKATNAYERFMRITALDYFEEAIYVYVLAPLQEKGLINLVASVDNDLIGSELAGTFTNDDFQSDEVMKSLVRNRSTRVLGSHTTVVTLDASAIIRDATGAINMSRLYPKFATKYRVPVRSLNFVQKFFGLGKVELKFGDNTKVINFGNFMTIGDESAADKRKIGYAMDRAIYYLSVYNPVDNGPAEWRDEFFKREIHWEYDKAIGDLGKKEFYIKISAMTVKGFCDNSVYHATDRLFGQRNGAPTITSGVITSANQHVRSDTGYLISLTQTNVADTTSAFHISPLSMVSMNDLLDYSILKAFFQPGEAHVNTFLYNSIKAYSIYDEDSLINVISPNADVTNEMEQVGMMWFVHDTGVIGDCTIEVLYRDFRIIDVTAPGLALAGGYKITVPKNMLPDLVDNEQFKNIYHPDARMLVMTRFGDVGSSPIAVEQGPPSNDNDNDNDGDSSAE